jgi:hypothetical protein
MEQRHDDQYEGIGLIHCLALLAIGTLNGFFWGWVFFG